MKSEYTYEVAVSYYAGTEEVKLKTNDTDEIMKFVKELIEAPFAGRRPISVIRPVDGPDLYDGGLFGERGYGHAMVYYGPGRRYRASLEIGVRPMKAWMKEVLDIVKELGL